MSMGPNELERDPYLPRSIDEGTLRIQNPFPSRTLQTPAPGNKGGGGPAEQVDSWKEDGRQKRG